MAEREKVHNFRGENELISSYLHRKDQQAFGLLVKPYLPGLRRYLYTAYRGNIGRAEEAEQDILLKLHKKLHTFRGESQFKSWFYSLAKRTNIDILRKIDKQRQNFNFQDLHIIECMDSQPTPEEEYLRGEKKQMVIDALLSLPSRYRRVLELKEIEGFSVAETATTLNIPEGTVKSRLSKGRRKLALAYERLKRGREENE